MSPTTAGRLPAEVLAENFAERLAPLGSDEAMAEASRCLYCFDAPCVEACPTSIDIPSFIRRIGTGDRLGAASKILSANVLGATCARVCATEELCEGSCVLGAQESPIMIGRLQRFATDVVVDAGLSIPHLPGEPTGRRIAVVGGGPAGLAAAATLRQCGHEVTIFERADQLGGLARYGIIPLREPTEIARWEADQVIDLGVEARTGVAVGIDLPAQELLDSFDAVFVGIGSGARVQRVGLAGSDTPGVEDALEFIERIRTCPPEQVAVGEHVVVVGAGNTAMDACIIAARLGARSVTCVYRRTAAEMTGYESEFAHCKDEGVMFRWLTQPLRVTAGSDGHVAALECARVELGEPDAGGRPRPVVTDDTFLLACDHVLVATGQQREPSVFEQFGLEMESDGRPVVRGAFRTSHPKVFAGGDAVLTGKELSVVDAVAQGRDAALAIDEMLIGGE